MLVTTAMAGGCVFALVTAVNVDRGGGAQGSVVSPLRPSATSQELVHALAAIERASAISGERRDIPIALDTSQGFATPWLWYLRDYPNLQLVNMQRAYDAPPGRVVLADARNRERVAAPGAVTTEFSLTENLADKPLVWTDPPHPQSDGWQADTVDGVMYLPGLLAGALPIERESDVLSSGIER
jgi:hypothetical protein